MNNKRHIITAGLTFILLLCLVLPSKHAHSQTITDTGTEVRGDFILEPGKMEIFLNPGESVVRNISVISRIGKNTKFKIVTEDFIGTQDADTPVLLLEDDSSPYSFRKNIEPSAETFLLSAGQKIQVPIKISVPLDAAPGGYYASVIVASLPDENVDSESGTTKIVSRIGVLLFIRVNGPVDINGKLEDFRVKGNSQGVIQKSPVNFEILYRNSGSVHLVPYGIIKIKNLIGKEIGSVPVDAYFSLPDSLRYRQVDFNKENLFGRYTATLTLNRGYGSTEDVMKLAFWVIPWKMLIISLLVILFIMLGVYLFGKKFELKKK